MKKDKIIIRINNLDEITEYKKVGITSFLFALEGFSVGYNEFNLEELKNVSGNVYLLINRVFDKEALDNFLKIKDKFEFIKGLFFEDIAVYQVLKNDNIPLFWNQMHAPVSMEAIKVWLEKVDGAVLANELVKDEISYIINNVKGNIVLPVLGLNPAMYSRRYLLTNYNVFKGFKLIKKSILKTGKDTEFLAVENKYGTMFFYHKYFNLINEIDNFDDEKIKFYYIDPNELTVKDVLDCLDGKSINFDNRFYENKTIYKVGDDK